MKKLQQVLSLFICFLMIMVVSINRDKKVLGYELSKSADTVSVHSVDTVKYLDDGTMEVNTSPLSKDVVGYAGTVPLKIRIKENKIVSVEALENVETPAFFSEASAILHEYEGKTPAEAQSMSVDAVSGATFSSKAIIENMQRGLAFAQAKKSVSSGSFSFDMKFIAALIVSLMAAVLPLFVKNKRYHLIQLILNTVVLGFWTGSFLSYTIMVRFMSNGINILTGLVFVILLITAFIYPLFGKKQYYCTHVCPLGSIQQLTAKTNKRRLDLSPSVLKKLNLFRQVLWAALMLCLWTGVLFEWMDYELFSAFIFRSASLAVIIMAVLFLILSFFINRPYCRFVCPTGTLFKYSEHLKK